MHFCGNLLHASFAMSTSISPDLGWVLYSFYRRCSRFEGMLGLDLLLLSNFFPILYYILQFDSVFNCVCRHRAAVNIPGQDDIAIWNVTINHAPLRPEIGLTAFFILEELSVQNRQKINVFHMVQALPPSEGQATRLAWSFSFFGSLELMHGPLA